MAADAVHTALLKDPRPPVVRLGALAWLIRSGLRRTACGGLLTEDLAAAFSGTVVFEVRTPEERIAARVDLGDSVVMYAAGMRETLSSVWDRHREMYDCQSALGDALGYLTPARARARFPPDGRQTAMMHHVALFGGVSVELWVEKLDPFPGEAVVEKYVSVITGILAEIGLTHQANIF